MNYKPGQPWCQSQKPTKMNNTLRLDHRRISHEKAKEVARKHSPDMTNKKLVKVDSKTYLLVDKTRNVDDVVRNFAASLERSENVLNKNLQAANAVNVPNKKQF